MTDAGPLVKIKQALTRLKNETMSMEIRIGVVQHTLLNAKVSTANQMVHEMSKAPVQDAHYF